MNNILFITTMYPDPLRPATDVCHFYTREWVKMGYNVIVINLRSMFPSVYTTMARIFPKLAHQYVGNHVEMDRNMNIIQHEVDRVKVYSIPVFKYVPHGKYPKYSILKDVNIIEQILKERDFMPEAIIGHFYNPTMEIIYELKKIYPAIKSAIVFHEGDPMVIKKNYSNNINEIIDSFDVLGFRNKTMCKKYEALLGPFKKKFICYSGTKSEYLKTPFYAKNKFSDAPLSKFLYVGQFTHNKSVISNIEALHAVYTDNKFKLTCIGSGGTAFSDIESYIKKNEIHNQVIFLGRLDRDKIIKYYDDNECFIMISKSEAFGLVYLEAMARGCIVVGTKGQGIDGVIIDGVNGFLCTGGDAKELSFIIKRINSLSVAEKEKISNSARKTAEELSDYNVAKMYIDAVINA